MKPITQAEIDAEAERLSAVRMQMLEAHPFWGYMLLQVRLVPAVELPSYVATDAVSHIWYNPARTRKLSIPELGFVLTHEICHQVLATAARQMGREPVKWNYATDYAINAMVSEIPMPGAKNWQEKLYQMPDNVLFDPKYRNWVVEVIYEDLCRKDLQSEVIYLELLLPSSEGGELRLPGVLDHQGGIDLHLPLELTADQLELLRSRIQAAVEHFEIGDSRGHLPKELLRETEVLEAPKIPWQRLLYHFAASALDIDDYSLARPNKRYRALDLVVPGLYSEKVGSIVVALDTSGSMSNEEISEVASEIRGIAPHTQDITLIVADSIIQQVIGFDELESFLQKGEFRGGGGTDHVCVFDYIASHHLDPTLFIGLSDLFSSFPEKQPPYPVIWVTTEIYGEVPWGKIIALRPRRPADGGL